MMAQLVLTEASRSTLQELIDHWTSKGAGYAAEAAEIGAIVGLSPSVPAGVTYLPAYRARRQR